MTGLGKRPLVATAGIACLALIVGCGQSVSDSDQPGSYVPRALKIQAERYGYTDEFTKCVTSTVLDDASALSGPSGRDVVRPSVVAACKARPNTKVLVEEPTRDQVNAYLAANERLIVSQNSGHGVSAAAAECIFNRVKDEFSPTEVATLVNGSGPEVHSVIPRYRGIQAACRVSGG